MNYPRKNAWNAKEQAFFLSIAHFAVFRGELTARPFGAGLPTPPTPPTSKNSDYPAFAAHVDYACSKEHHFDCTYHQTKPTRIIANIVYFIDVAIVSLKYAN